MKGSYSTTYTPADSLVKLVQALGYLLSLDDNKKMHRVKLIKLLWVADRFHMRRYGRTVSESRYYAMPHGPVCSLALDIAQLNRDFALDDDDISYISEFFTTDGYSTAMSKNPGEDYLSETDKEMMRKAYQVFNSAEDFDLADQISPSGYSTSHILMVVNVALNRLTKLSSLKIRSETIISKRIKMC